MEQQEENAKKLMLQRRALIQQSLEIRDSDPGKSKLLEQQAEQMYEQAQKMGGVSADDMQYLSLMGES